MPPSGPRRRTILAMGGGGFTAGAGDPALDELVLRARRPPRPRMCLLPTAGGDSEHQIRRFYETFGDRLCEPSHVSLFRLGRKPVPLREHLLGAGRDLRRRRLDGQPAGDLARPGARRDPARRLARRRRARRSERRLDVLVRVGRHDVVRRAGGRARASASCPDRTRCTTTASPRRRPVYLDAVRSGAIPSGWAVDDGAALIFRGDELCRGRDRPRRGARAYDVTAARRAPAPGPPARLRRPRRAARSRRSPRCAASAWPGPAACATRTIRPCPRS